MNLVISGSLKKILAVAKHLFCYLFYNCNLTSVMGKNSLTEEDEETHRGILKAPTETFSVEPDIPPEVERLQQQTSDTGVTWDERVIAEHDKLRGTRMKIEEPNTPYYICQDSIESSDPDCLNSSNRNTVTPEELTERLEELHEKQLRQSESDSSDHSDTDDAPSKRKFEQRRKAHYNEFRVLKELRSSGSFDLSDE